MLVANTNPKIGLKNRKNEAFTGSIFNIRSHKFTEMIDTGITNHNIENMAVNERVTLPSDKYMVIGNKNIAPNNTCQPLMAYLDNVQVLSE